VRGRWPTASPGGPTTDAGYKICRLQAQLASQWYNLIVITTASRRTIVKLAATAARRINRPAVVSSRSDTLWGLFGVSTAALHQLDHALKLPRMSTYMIAHYDAIMSCHTFPQLSSSPWQQKDNKSPTSCHVRTVSDCIPKSPEDLSLQSLFLMTSLTTSL